MRTNLGTLVPQRYDAGALARSLQSADVEFTRLTSVGATLTWDPASVANGASTTTTLTAPGVKANVRASVRVFPPYSLQGLICGAYVSADDTVTVVLNNNSGGAVNLGSGSWGVLVENFVITG